MLRTVTSMHRICTGGHRTGEPVTWEGMNFLHGTCTTSGVGIPSLEMYCVTDRDLLLGRSEGQDPALTMVAGRIIRGQSKTNERFLRVATCQHPAQYGRSFRRKSMTA